MGIIDLFVDLLAHTSGIKDKNARNGCFLQIFLLALILSIIYIIYNVFNE